MTVRVSVDGQGTGGNSWSKIATLSEDGRLVSYMSDASNLVAGDTNASWDVFVHDLGPACEPGADQDDVDCDGVSNVRETECGSDPQDSASVPERVDGLFANNDEDGDGQTDEALPAGAEAYDCDGDGYVGTAEAHVFGGAGGSDQDPCGTDAWPSDLDSTAGGPLDSFNRITILDATRFLAPVKYLGTDVGTNPGDARWDLATGKGPFSTEINVMDLVSLIAGPTGYPPMLGGARALGGPGCPWPP